MECQFNGDVLQGDTPLRLFYDSFLEKKGIINQFFSYPFKNNVDGVSPWRTSPIYF